MKYKVEVLNQNSSVVATYTYDNVEGFLKDTGTIFIDLPVKWAVVVLNLGERVPITKPQKDQF